LAKNTGVGWDPVVSTGLLDDFDFTIEKARFGYDDGYQNGEVLLMILEGTSPDSEAEGNFVRQFYSVGSGWDTEDRGKTAVSDDGLSGFRSSTNYMAFIKAALDTEANDVLMERGTPDNAEIWEGLTFHMERVLIERKGLGDFEVLLPTSYVEGNGDSKKKKKSPKAEAGRSGSSKGKGLRSKLVKLANKVSEAGDDHDDFVTAVYEKYPEIEDPSNEELHADVLDEDDGIWSEIEE
jgi:hypothetical protein